ncbi:hypothetical protein N9C37_03915 [Planktomarina temperata]|nr:hypothetical protein [Planktomarina temperata]
MKPRIVPSLALALGLWCCMPIVGLAHEGVKCSERNLDQAIRALGSRRAAETYFTPYITLTKKDVYWARSEYRIVGLTDNQSRSEVHGTTQWNGFEMTLMYHEAAQVLWVTMQPWRKGQVIPTVAYTKCATLD